MSDASMPIPDFSIWPPGCTWNSKYSIFRLYSPQATLVEIEIWDSFDQEVGHRYAMSLGEDGYWSARVSGNVDAKWYGYHVSPPDPLPYNMEPSRGAISDPWSKHVASQNNYLQHSRSLIESSDSFDWEGDSWVEFDDPRDMIIYEAHLKDFTAHPNLKLKDAGSYRGFLNAGETAGIEYLKKLGVNAVEFLPLHKSARFEPPYLETTASGVSNTWNYYGRNHWGYMTSHYFVPETMYASNADQTADAYTGTDLSARNELRSVVKELHRNNIAVILDVAYNHVSQYDINSLKQAAKGAYFRLDEDGNYTSVSGCGNDSNTQHPEFRKLIVASVIYWMREYHIDGFRFDLAHLIDWVTIDEITHEARKINPNVILIAEPWGGGYDPIGFSKRGWLAWNDQIRNGVKGFDPVHSRGFIFGTWHHESDRRSIENYLKGTLIGGSNGRFETSRTTLNYLESHDGYTLGDFIRIGLNHHLLHDTINREQVVKLHDAELKLSKLGALYLLAAQGVVMIHQGQEYGRTKWIVPDPVNDPNTGRLDHNSYDKNNQTNYIDYNDVKLNIDLLNYYKGLIELRTFSPALRKSHPESIHIVAATDNLLLTATVDGESTNDPYSYIIGLNGNGLIEHELVLPEGFWEIVVTEYYASNKSLTKISGRVIIPPSTGMILRQRR